MENSRGDFDSDGTIEQVVHLPRSMRDTLLEGSNHDDGFANGSSEGSVMTKKEWKDSLGEDRR